MRLSKFKFRNSKKEPNWEIIIKKYLNNLNKSIKKFLEGKKYIKIFKCGKYNFSVGREIATIIFILLVLYFLALPITLVLLILLIFFLICSIIGLCFYYPDDDG